MRQINRCRSVLTRPVFLPIIIGTPRQGRFTEPAANFVFGEVSKRSDIETKLIDIRKIPIRMDDAGEALKDSEFSVRIDRADGLILVVPEYNHSFPGLLKHVLDTNLKEYIHKAVGVCGVSASPIRRRADDPEFAPGAARTRKAFRPGHWGNWLGTVGNMKESITFSEGGSFIAQLRPQGFISNTLSQGVTGTIRGTWAINGRTITLKITSAEDERVNNSVTSSTILAFNQDELSMKSDRGRPQLSFE